MHYIEVHHITSASFDWLSDYQSWFYLLALKSSLFSLFNSDKICEIQSLVLGILDHESSINWALIFNRESEFLLGIDFSKTKIQNWLNEFNNGTSEICLTRKADWRSIFYLYVKVSDCFTTLRALNVNLKLNVFVDFSFYYGAFI